MSAWYDKKSVVIILLIIFYPVGLFALWKGKNFSPIIKKILTAIFVIPIIVAVVSSSDIPEVDQAKPYTIVERADAGFLGRDRYFIDIISPQATNHAQFAQTAIQAARDIQKETGADVVAVNLQPSIVSIGEGISYAIARYAPDGRGLSGKDHWKWEVEAAERTLNKADILISDIWWENNLRFQRDGVTDEPTLIAFISEKTGIIPNQIHLPLVIRKQYDF